MRSAIGLGARAVSAVGLDVASGLSTSTMASASARRPRPRSAGSEMSSVPRSAQAANDGSSGSSSAIVASRAGSSSRSRPLEVGGHGRLEAVDLGTDLVDAAVDGGGVPGELVLELALRVVIRASVSSLDAGDLGLRPVADPGDVVLGRACSVVTPSVDDARGWPRRPGARRRGPAPASGPGGRRRSHGSPPTGRPSSWTASSGRPPGRARPGLPSRPCAGTPRRLWVSVVAASAAAPRRREIVGRRCSRTMARRACMSGSGLRLRVGGGRGLGRGLGGRARSGAIGAPREPETHLVSLEAMGGDSLYGWARAGAAATVGGWVGCGAVARGTSRGFRWYRGPLRGYQPDATSGWCPPHRIRGARCAGAAVRTVPPTATMTLPWSRGRSRPRPTAPTRFDGARACRTASAAPCGTCGSRSRIAATSAARTACRPRSSAATSRSCPREVLSFEEIERLATIFVGLGVRKLRITGGEPLVRRDLPALIAYLAPLRTPEGEPVDLTLTTNGSALGPRRAARRRPGCNGSRVSLDSLDDAVFGPMNGVDFPVSRVLDGIAAAREAGLSPIKINTVVRRGMNEDVDPAARPLGARRGADPAVHRVHGRRALERLAPGRRRAGRGDRGHDRRRDPAGAGAGELSRRGRGPLPVPRRRRRARASSRRSRGRSAGTARARGCRPRASSTPACSPVRHRPQGADAGGRVRRRAARGSRRSGARAWTATRSCAARPPSGCPRWRCSPSAVDARRVRRRYPQVVHSGGKLVDAGGAREAEVRGKAGWIARRLARNVGLARRGRWKDRSGGDRLKPAPPGRLRSPQRHVASGSAITSRVGAPGRSGTSLQSGVARKGGDAWTPGGT